MVGFTFPMNELELALLEDAINLHKEGKLCEAQKIYEAFINNGVNNVYVLHLLGNIYLNQNKDLEALNIFNQALLLDSKYANIYRDRGVALLNLKQATLAIENYKSLLLIEPEDSTGFCGLGNALCDLQEFSLAVEMLDCAIRLNPNFSKAHFSRGIALKGLNQLDMAISSYDQSIKLNPNFASAYYNRGLAHQESGDLTKAIADYDQAIVHDPNFVDAFYNRGAAWQTLESYALAIRSYDEAIKLCPSYVPAYYSMQLPIDAIFSYDQALNFSPNNSEAKFNKSLALLMIGDFIRGWELYEWRFKGGAKELREYQFSNKLWDGIQTLENKIILVRGEQGLGDIIQFCRYAKILCEMGAKVILEVPKTLVKLLDSLRGPWAVIADNGPSPQYDYEVPLMSLPHHLKTTALNIPSSDQYLCASKERVEYWGSRLKENNKPRIGIVWNSFSNYKNDAARSIPLDVFLNIYIPEKFDYICLQKCIKKEDADKLRPYPEILFFGGSLDTMEDTAGLIQNLDLVISIDTSVAHLSAALGKPTWILNRYAGCWRWQLGRADSPWYKAVKLYGQPSPGDWVTPLDCIRSEMIKYFNT
jgi:Tfp pilus assembly protein PilF